MSRPLARSSAPDRLEVFISSTIGECALERASVRRAIHSLNFVPVQFEREGARAEAPRDFYLRKLQSSHIVVAIYRSSYGWVDQPKGMAISGLEDEYRETIRLGKDLLAYVLKAPVNRDVRLTGMLAELQAGPHTIYFYEDGEDLESRVRDDLTALISNRVVGSQNERSRPTSAADLLNSIFRGSAFRIRRSTLLTALTNSAALARIVWLTGASGAGKTALAAEWADERGAAYINARGLDPRSVLIAAAHVLHLASDAELNVPVYDDARTLLLSRWNQGRNWPLVIDDPDDIEAIWAVLNECLASSSIGSVVVVAKNVPLNFPGQRLEVKGFSPDELAALHSIAGIDSSNITAGQLPLALRDTNRGESATQRFAGLEAPSREILGYLALSPTSLVLDDFLALLGSSVSSAVDLSDRLDGLTDLIMETSAGFSFIHDLDRASIVEVMSTRLQLQALLLDRLSDRLSNTGRSWAAFTLRRHERSERTEILANQAIREAVFTGSTRQLGEALEFLIDYYRSRGEKGLLLSVLMTLADNRANQGRPDEAPQLVEEAISLAKELGDDEAEQMLEILQASLALRRSASQSALERVRALRAEAQRDGRHGDEARLLLDEGTALLGANETDLAVSIYREARALFTSVEDGYGVEIATRNLIIALAGTSGGMAESDRLRAELHRGEVQSPRYRAWLCNLLVPRLRRDKRFTEAEAMAREAISIGETLGDQYIIAINTMVLGNVLRDAGRIAEAIDAYTVAGARAREIGRPDIEGRSSRLLALTENEIAKAAGAEDRRLHATLAEKHATHAAGLFADSFGWIEYGHALEERGDARRMLGRHSTAKNDFADAVAAFLRSGATSEVERLLPQMILMLATDAEAPIIIARSFGVVASQEKGPSGVWVQALVAAVDKCPLTVAPNVLGVLVRSFDSGRDGTWWFDCLVRALLSVNQCREDRGREGIGSLLLLSILAYAQHRDFSVQQLLILAGLCIHRTDKIVLRHKPGSDLVQIIRLGKDNRVLLTILDEAKYPDATFVALVIGAFLDAFGSEVAAILFGDGLPEGAALDVAVFSQLAGSFEVSDVIEKGLKDRPVAVARFDSTVGEEVPIILFTRNDAIKTLRAVPNRGGEIEIMLARLLEEVLHATLGASLDDEIYGSKMRDLLIKILG